MKPILIISILLSALVSYSQDTIQISQAKEYLAKEVTICDKVVETHTSKSEKGPISLNFGNLFPNQTFTAVIFKSDLINFDYDPAQILIDKNVCISGIVTTYKDWM